MRFNNKIIKLSSIKCICPYITKSIDRLDLSGICTCICVIDKTPENVNIKRYMDIIIIKARYLCQHSADNWPSS